MALHEKCLYKREGRSNKNYAWSLCSRPLDHYCLRFKNEWANKFNIFGCLFSAKIVRSISKQIVPTRIFVLRKINCVHRSCFNTMIYVKKGKYHPVIKTNSSGEILLIDIRQFAEKRWGKITKLINL